MGGSKLAPAGTPGQISREEAWERALRGGSFFRYIPAGQNKVGVIVVSPDGEFEADLGTVEMVPKGTAGELSKEVDLAGLFEISVSCEA